MITLVEEDADILSLAGTFQRWNIDPPIPASVAIFAYLYKEENADSFLGSKDRINPSAGAFTSLALPFWMLLIPPKTWA